MKADQPVVIVDYDPFWPEMYSAERERILSAVGQHRIMIEHCGSTAVPGLAAKPIIDILGGLDSLQDALACIQPLAWLGYEYHPHLEDALPDRRFFVRYGAGGERTIHLHLCELNRDFWRKHLLFRDILRAQAATARAYEALKRDLAEKYHNNREAYTEAKTDFIETVLRKAGYVTPKL